MQNHTMSRWRGVLCDTSIDLPFKRTKRIDKRGVRNDSLHNRFLTIAANGEISIIDHLTCYLYGQSKEPPISIRKVDLLDSPFNKGVKAMYYKFP